MDGFRAPDTTSFRVRSLIEKRRRKTADAPANDYAVKAFAGVLDRRIRSIEGMIANRVAVGHHLMGVAVRAGIIANTRSAVPILRGQELERACGGDQRGSEASSVPFKKSRRVIFSGSAIPSALSITGVLSPPCCQGKFGLSCRVNRPEFRGVVDRWMISGKYAAQPVNLTLRHSRGLLAIRIASSLRREDHSRLQVTLSERPHQVCPEDMLAVIGERHIPPPCFRITIAAAVTIACARIAGSKKRERKRSTDCAVARCTFRKENHRHARLQRLFHQRRRIALRSCRGGPHRLCLPWWQTCRRSATRVPPASPQTRRASGRHTPARPDS